MSGERARSVAAIFSPHRLRIARQAAGLRKSELARRVEVTPAAIGQYENAVTRPGAAVLARLALALEVPVEFFADDGRPMADTDTSRAFFRSLRKTTLVERERALARAELVWEIAQTLQRRVRFPSVTLPTDLAIDGARSVQEIEDLAAALRERWRLGTGPVPNVVRLLEAHGVIVSRLTADTANVSAFSRWFADRPVVVLSTDMDDKARSRFDAAHELGHLVMHPDPEPGSHLLEHQAQTFAAAFLMPAPAIRADLPQRADWRRLVDLKATWGVSLQALLYRARTLGRMSESAYRRAMTKLSASGWRRREPGELGPPEVPILLRRGFELLEAGGYTVKELGEATRLSEQFVRDVIFSEPGRPEIRLG